MEQEIENLNSPNEEGTPEPETTENADEAALKEKNRQLFERAKKAETELKELRAKQKEPKSEEPQPDTNEFGEPEKLQLEVAQIPEEDWDYLLSEVKTTGKALREVRKMRYVQDELKTRAQTRASQNAIPSGNNRGGSAPRDTVDFWIEKGELPPSDQHELRVKVVEEKRRRAENKNIFTNRPIV